MTEPVWHYYEWERPQQDLPIIIECRGYYGDSFYETVIVPKNLSPFFNVSGLRWRPTGIFRELEGKISQCGQQQANSSGWLCGMLSGLALGAQRDLIGACAFNSIIRQGEK